MASFLEVIWHPVQSVWGCPLFDRDCALKDFWFCGVSRNECESAGGSFCFVFFSKVRPPRLCVIILPLCAETGLRKYEEGHAAHWLCEKPFVGLRTTPLFAEPHRCLHTHTHTPLSLHLMSSRGIFHVFLTLVIC